MEFQMPSLFQLCAGCIVICLAILLHTYLTKPRPPQD